MNSVPVIMNSHFIYHNKLNAGTTHYVGIQGEQGYSSTHSSPRRSTLGPGLFILTYGNPVVDWVSPTAGLNIFEKRKISCSNRNLHNPNLQPRPMTTTNMPTAVCTFCDQKKKNRRWVTKNFLCIYVGNTHSRSYPWLVCLGLCYSNPTNASEWFAKRAQG